MGRVDDLQKELNLLKQKRENEATIKKLKKRIKYEKFSQTKTGKIMNKVADFGEAGLKAGKNYLAKQEGKQKKKTKSINEILKDLPQ